MFSSRFELEPFVRVNQNEKLETSVLWLTIYFSGLIGREIGTRAMRRFDHLKV